MRPLSTLRPRRIKASLTDYYAGRRFVMGDCAANMLPRIGLIFFKRFWLGPQGGQTREPLPGEFEQFGIARMIADGIEIGIVLEP